MKKQLLLILLSAISFEIYAQMPHPAQCRDITTKSEIDNSKLQVIYDCTIRRVDHLPSYTADVQVLEIGDNYSRYYSRNSETADSLFYAGGEQRMRKDANGNIIDAVYEDVYTDYPTKGNISVYNRYLKRTFVYSEPRPQMEWQVTQESEEVLGYSCIKATTLFRGRSYSVWFTPEIPISSGPWKFNGLPGLILKAEDSDKYFTFLAIGINQNPHVMLTYKERAQKCKRKDILKLNDLRWADMELLIEVMSGQETIAIERDYDGTIRESKSQGKIIVPQMELE